MAINIDTVYKTVLSILNKEQRGYITPNEFNKVAAQVQLEIFNKYFEDLNQLTRIAQVDIEYANRVDLLDERLSIFKATSVNLEGIGGVFAMPSTSNALGSVIYNDVELQRVQRSELYNLNKSNYTKPSNSYPIYLYEDDKIKIYPNTITSGVSINFLRKPLDPVWGFTVGSRGQYVYDTRTYAPLPAPAIGSRNFELHVSEQITVILKILLYSGVIIKDPQVIQAATQQVQAEEINSKS